MGEQIPEIPAHTQPNVRRPNSHHPWAINHFRSRIASYFDAPSPEMLQDVILLLARAVETGKKPETIAEEQGPNRPVVVQTNQGEALRFRSGGAWAV